MKVWLAFALALIVAAPMAIGNAPHEPLAAARTDDGGAADTMDPEPGAPMPEIESSAWSQAGGLIPQDDAHSGGDAIDACHPGEPPLLPLQPYAVTSGQTFPIFDRFDHFRLDVDPMFGVHLSIRFAPLVSDSATIGAIHVGAIETPIQATVMTPECQPVPVDVYPSTLGMDIVFHPTLAGYYVVQIEDRLLAGFTSGPGGSARAPVFAGEALAAPTAASSPTSAAPPLPDASGVACHPPCMAYGYGIRTTFT